MCLYLYIMYCVCVKWLQKWSWQLGKIQQKLATYSLNHSNPSSPSFLLPCLFSFFSLLILPALFYLKIFLLPPKPATQFSHYYMVGFIKKFFLSYIFNVVGCFVSNNKCRYITHTTTCIQCWEPFSTASKLLSPLL